MENTIDPTHLLAGIAKILDKLKIQYYVTGGMAVFVWGRPRFTADVDIVVALKSEDVDGLVLALRSLGEFGYIDKDAVDEALARHSEFNFIDGNTGVKVDFWILKPRDIVERSRLKRRVTRKVLDYGISFISPEDLILNKLYWCRESESSRHLEDAESVLKISGDKLDMKYLKKQAEKLGLSDDLSRLFSKIKPAPRPK